MSGSGSRRPLRQAAWTIATIVLLLAVAWARSRATVLEGWSLAGRVLDAVGRSGLSDWEEERAAAGYYETLLDEGDRASGGIRSLLPDLGLEPELPADWRRLRESEAVVARPGFLDLELRPDVRIRFKGAPLETNRWGFRDRDYSLAKPPGVRRIALAASSIAMGSGVPAKEVFEALLEERWNATLPCTGVTGYEVLNLSVEGYYVTELLAVAVEKAAPFDSDAVVFSLNGLAVNRYWSRHLVRLVSDGRDLRWDFLRDVVRRAAIHAADPPARIASRLAPYRREVIEGVLRTVHAAMAEQGRVLVLLEQPQVGGMGGLRRELPEIHRRVADLALPVIPALDAFAGHGLEGIRLAPRDHHPNALGHRLIFEEIQEQVAADPVLQRALLGCALGG